MTVQPRSAAQADGIEARSNLTRGQFLIWTGQRLAPDAPIYNMGWRFDIAAPLQPGHFQRAFDAVVAGCDALRTVILEEGGVPQQHVLDGGAGALEVLDTAPESPAAWIDRRVARPLPIAERTFDAVLFPQSGTLWTLVLIQHHVIADALSGQLIFDALAKAYEQGTQVDELDGNRLPSFSDWAKRERIGRDLTAVRYWAEQLAEPLQPPRLYTRPLHPPHPACSRHLVPLGPERTARLDAITETVSFSALTSQQSRFQILLTVLSAWIARVSAERHFALGIATHGRRTLEEKRTPGLFMELFPLEAQLDPDETFTSLHSRLSDGTFDVLRHAAPGTSSAEGHSRFNVVLNYIPGSFREFAGSPVRVEWLDHRHCDPNHALWLDVTDFSGSGEPVLAFRFNESVFDPDLQAQALAEFLCLLDALLDNPDTAVDAVPLAAESSASAALTRPAEPAPAAPPDVLAAFSARVEAAPNALAIEGDGGALSRAELAARAAATSAALHSAGVGPGGLVGLHLRRSPDLVAAMLGTLSLGAAYVPLDPAQPAGRLDAIEAEAGLRVTLTERHLNGRWSGRGLRIAMEDVGADTGVPPSTDSDRPAYVLFTSGSTGRPKGVQVSRRALSRYAHWANETFASGEPATWALHSAIGFDLTVTSIFAPLVGGGVIRIYREPDAPGDLSILRVFAEDAVDVVKLTPAHLALALEDTQQISRIRTLVLGGEDLGTALAARARAALGDVRVFNEYGPTEATVGCMLHEFDERRDLEASVPIGRPAEATRTYVLDAGLNPAPDDVIGDLYVGGPDRLANGYLDQPAATAESFVPDPFVAGARMYRTGDLASVRSDGVLRYHGRADDQTKINGVRVELGEIRRAVMAHPEITACALSFISPAPVDPRRCTDCGLGNDHPEADIDGTGRCRLCRDYAVYRERAAAYFRDMDDLAGLLREAADRRTGPYDCLMLLSGGKDSTYALARLSELTPRILCATLDNGYISEGAKTNIRKVCATLGLDHRFIATPHMREIFADSLARHANVCNGCFKTIYTLGLKLARDEGIPAIVTGLSRGQLFETRLAPELFSDAITNADAIDRTVMEARKAYHRVPDAAARRLNGNLFADEAIFDEISFIDFYRYCDVPVDEVYRHLAEHVGWLRPADTGRSTNCLINDVGIYVHKRRMGYHNYALPYSWDVRMAHKSREAALEELDDDIDTARVRRILNEVGYPDPPAAERSPQLVCHYSARSPLASRELRRHLAAHLPREMIQAELVPIDRVPLTPNGKIDYAALPDPALVPSDPDATPTPPSTETEAALASIWAEILGRTVGIDDNFFEVGGDSIAAIRIASAASRKGFGVSAVDVLRLQTVAAISAAADQVEVETPARRTRATLDARSAARLAEIFGSRSGG